MHQVMFDVDGTLVESFDFDEKCYMDAVYSVLGHQLDNDWSKYSHVTDSGILDHHLGEKDLLNDREEIHAKVKSAFVNNIESYLSTTPAKQVCGAADFISFLLGRRDICLSIATGGWGETALLKLESAGIDTFGIPLASSNDHFSRTEIMRIALNKTGEVSDYRPNYFGDAAWDKEACKHLNFNFIVVGDRVQHDQAINNFADFDSACRFIGL